MKFGGSKPKSIYRAYATATSGAIALEVNPGWRFKLLKMELLLNTAPTTSQSLTITVDRGLGSTYDTIIFSRDLSVGSLTSLAVEFGDNFVYEAADHLDVAWTNTDGRTYGIVVTCEKV